MDPQPYKIWEFESKLPSQNQFTYNLPILAQIGK